jgi:thiol:disulfide interchange protein DsbD
MKNLSVKIFATLALLFSFWNAQAQFIEQKDIVKANITIEQTDCEAFVVVKINIKENWHINSNKLPEGSFSIPSDIIINESKQFKLGPILEPKPHVFKDAIGDMQSQHKNSLVIKRKIDVLSTSDFVLNGTFTFQTCDEEKCLPEDGYKFSLDVKGCPAAENQVAPLDTVSKTQVQNNDVNKNETQAIQNQNQTAPTEAKVPDSLWMIFLLSFLSGFAALITPCVFPMVPMTVTFFTKRSKTKAAGIRNAVIFGVSIIVIYVLLGTLKFNYTWSTFIFTLFINLFRICFFRKKTFIFSCFEIYFETIHFFICLLC